MGFRSRVFCDSIVLEVVGGDGGPGSVSVRGRQKLPDGGDGGNGGDILLIASEKMEYLQFIHGTVIKGLCGQNGRDRCRYGANGLDVLLEVPLGTHVIDQRTNILIDKMLKPGQTLVVARGANGQNGNIHLQRYAQKTTTYISPPETNVVHLELHILADVSIAGYPNSGRSLFMCHFSSAKPKTADYPYTTRAPYKSYATYDEQMLSIVDIPSVSPSLELDFARHMYRSKLWMLFLQTDQATYGTYKHQYATLCGAIVKQTGLIKPHVVVVLDVQAFLQAPSDIVGPQPQGLTGELAELASEIPVPLYSVQALEDIDRLKRVVFGLFFRASMRCA